MASASSFSDDVKVTESTSYQPNGRFGHTSHVVGDNLYIWCGKQRDLPDFSALDHYNDRIRRDYSWCVEIFNLATGKWKQAPTAGSPPLGVMFYASAVIDNNIFYFGGYCGHIDCYHNSLFSLSVDDLTWKALSPTNRYIGPNTKKGCGMVPVKIDGQDYLFVFGGKGKLINTPRQRYAKYSDEGRSNEQYLYDLSTGKWVSPTVNGERPPPCNNFSLVSLTSDTFVLFGGFALDDWSNTVYLGHCTDSTINWQKTACPSPINEVNWPKCRYNHAAAFVDEHHIIVIGGKSTGKCNDCWLLNVTTKLWKELILPQSVTERYHHSLSSFNVTSDIVWVIVFGGFRAISDTTVIELIRNDEGEWCVGEILTHPLNDYEQKLAEKRRQLDDATTTETKP